MRTHETSPGEWLGDAVRQIISLARTSRHSATTFFNGIKLTARPGDKVEDIVSFYWSKNQSLREQGKEEFRIRVPDPAKMAQIRRQVEREYRTGKRQPQLVI